MRILLVEDNSQTADYLQKALKSNCYMTDLAFDGKEGLFLAENNPYDLIILDVMLPHLDGFTLVQKIRTFNNRVPILFLTARDAVDDRVKGLEFGADDYLVKPFAFVELLARIRTLLRRKQTQSSPFLQVADLQLDINKHKATRNGVTLHLSPKEFMLLTLLMQRKGEVLSRTHIAEQVWDIHFDNDSNAIDVAIKRLRSKVDMDFLPQLIHTIRGVGYVLEVRDLCDLP